MIMKKEKNKQTVLKNKDKLREVGIIKSKISKCADIFNEFIETDFLTNKEKPSEYVRVCWDKYKEWRDGHEINNANSLNGKMMEIIIATLLVKEGVLPLYIQAEVLFVPNVIFDFILYSKKSGPINLSIKTSLRERYKQADLEAVALKYVHRKAKSYLITLDKNEAGNIKSKIEKSELLGIDDVIVASDDSFNEFIRELSSPENMLDESPVEKIVTAVSVVPKGNNTKK